MDDGDRAGVAVRMRTPDRGHEYACGLKSSAQRFVGSSINSRSPERGRVARSCRCTVRCQRGVLITDATGRRPRVARLRIMRPTPPPK